MMIDGIDERLLGALADGLPLTPHPYADVGNWLGLSEGQVLSRLRRLVSGGVIKRFGVIVRHRELGYVANAMVVWDIPDQLVSGLAHKAIGFECVTLCYERPRSLPDWPYNLFCMIHGKSRETVLKQIEELNKETGLQYWPSEVLFSGKCFKQKGARYHAAPEIEPESVPELALGVA